MELPELEDPFEKLIKDLSGDIKQYLIKKELGEFGKHYQVLDEIINNEKIQARMPFIIEIE